MARPRRNFHFHGTTARFWLGKCTAAAAAATSARGKGGCAKKRHGKGGGAKKLRGRAPRRDVARLASWTLSRMAGVRTMSFRSYNQALAAVTKFLRNVFDDVLAYGMDLEDAFKRQGRVFYAFSYLLAKPCHGCCIASSSSSSGSSTGSTSSSSGCVTCGSVLCGGHCGCSTSSSSSSTTI